MADEVKDVVEETKTEEVIPATTEEIKSNEELLKANAKIAELEAEEAKLREEIRKKEAEAKEKAFNDLLIKNKVKTDFHEFVKWKLKWQELSDLDKALSEFIKENPALVETITTGGVTEETVKTDGEPSENENVLLKYKEENNL